MTTALDGLVAALETHGCQPRNGTARCPAHDDTNPSLSYGQGRDGAVIHCHTGCAPDTILNALNLHKRDLFDQPIEPQGQRRLEDTYTYTTATGQPLYRVQRWRMPDGTKTFLQQHLRDGRWVNGRGGIDPVLYRLDEINNAPIGTPIWVVEGEKDVETLRQLGAVATCNTGGAGSWRPEHTQQLADRHVRIIADNDPAGHAHAHHIATELWPDQPPEHLAGIYTPTVGKDVSDLAAITGATSPADLLQHLQPLTPTTEPTDPTETPESPRVQLVDWATFWDRPDTEDWLCRPLLPRNRGIAMFAKGGTGKSLLGLAAAAALATGQPFLQQPPGPPRHVLYLDYEMTEDDLAERLEKFGYGRHSDLTHLHYALLPALPPLDAQTGADDLLELALSVDAELVVIDTFGRAVSGDENDADTVRTYYRLTGMALKNAGMTTLRIDHAGKDSDRGQRGSSAKNDDVDVVWELKPSEDGFLCLAWKRRVSWVDEKLSIGKHDDGTRVTFSMEARSWKEGTKAAAEWLASVDAPVDISKNKAWQLCQEHKADATADPVNGHTRDAVRDAVEFRSQQTPELVMTTGDSHSANPPLTANVSCLRQPVANQTQNPRNKGAANPPLTVANPTADTLANPGPQRGPGSESDLEAVLDDYPKDF